MPRYRLDTDTLATAVAERLRGAAASADEAPTERRERVVRELVHIRSELRRLADDERSYVEQRAGAQLRVSNLGRLVSEAGLQAPTLDRDWLALFATLAV